MVLSNCAVCAAVKKLRFIKEQESIKLLSKLWMKNSLSRVPFLFLSIFGGKMNEMIKTFLSTGHKFTPQMDLI